MLRRVPRRNSLCKGIGKVTVLSVVFFCIIT
jgi:hypothetical protein